MKIKDILCALEKFAPLPLQDGFDNAGLQIGVTEAETTGALLCLDVTEDVIDEAITKHCNLIIAHHPLLFKGCKSITGKNYIERCIIKAIKNDIAIYASHTNMDNAPQGVNFKIAEKIGLTDIHILETRNESLLKLVTFVPDAYADKVRNALFTAGCGCIGNYDSCSYNLKGNGTFKANDKTHPFCGEIGELHTESEIRIETIIPAFLQEKAIRTLLEVHPYEEPAYDLYPLTNNWEQVGSGIVGMLTKPVSENQFLQHLKSTFNVSCLRFNKPTGRLIQKVSLCGGAGSFLLPKAIACNADTFITGEIKYHDFFGHEKDILMIEMGHYESEQYTIEIFEEILKKSFPSLKTEVTKINTNPINYL